MKIKIVQVPYTELQWVIVACVVLTDEVELHSLLRGKKWIASAYLRGSSKHSVKIAWPRKTLVSEFCIIQEMCPKNCQQRVDLTGSVLQESHKSSKAHVQSGTRWYVQLQWQRAHTNSCPETHSLASAIIWDNVQVFVCYRYPTRTLTTMVTTAYRFFLQKILSLLIYEPFETLDKALTSDCWTRIIRGVFYTDHESVPRGKPLAYRAGNIWQNVTFYAHSCITSLLPRPRLNEN